MSGEASLINAAGDSVGRKVPVLGISIGAAETAKEGWDAKNAFGRAANRNRSKQKRIAANRAATIYSRRAILKAASTVAGQIPGYGTAAALALDGVNALLNVGDGKPPKSGTSIGANYREASRARSRDDFIHKIGICEKETSKTECWLELAQGADLIADGSNLAS